jgi:hypothetical protein
LKKTGEVQQVETVLIERQDIVGKKFNSRTIDAISPQDADGLDQHLRVGCTIWTITDNSIEEHLRQLIEKPDLAREFGETFLKGWSLEEFIKTATSMIPKLGGEKKIVLSNLSLYANMPLDELCKKFAAWCGKKRIARTGHDGQQKVVKAAAEANRIKVTEGRAKDVRRLFDAAMSLAPDWPELELFYAESGNDPCEAELFVYNDSMAPRSRDMLPGENPWSNGPLICSKSLSRNPDDPHGKHRP